MDEAFLDLESVEVELDEELLDAIDDKAFADHRENRDAAVRDLLDEWLKQRAVEDTDERD
jgi:Arc/MetJ-type ribon-helix-helix transcriptional regulator